MSDFQLDKLDHQILSMVGDDARVPFLEVARICGVSGAAIHQRVTRLTRLGVLRGSHFDMNPEVLGYDTIAFIGLYLKDVSTFDSVAEKLRKIPEIVECHYTTGGYDMFIKVYAKNNSHLLSIIHDQLQPLGLSRSETIISFREAIKRQIPVPKYVDDEVEE
ncbi:MAG: Lrp/AsnC ligand binding domain-containing protein [Bacteroidaceae bacterium]|nr:Lrp/AsnC ligand binding domain-containing protein [Bacteroidaceae bacterium]